MPAVCRICRHQDRLVIEQMIVNQKSMRQIARQFALGDHKTVARHMKHMGADLLAAEQSTPEQRGRRLLERIKHLDTQVDNVIHRAAHPEPVTEITSSGDPITHTPPPNDRMLLSAVREARANAELVARLVGDLREDPGTQSVGRVILDDEARRMAAEIEERLAAQADAEREA